MQQKIRKIASRIFPLSKLKRLKRFYKKKITQSLVLTCHSTFEPCISKSLIDDTRQDNFISSKIHVVHRGLAKLINTDEKYK